MRIRAHMVVALLVAVPLAGCIENMSDLKDRLSGTGVTPPEDKTPITNASRKNLTLPGLQPVARIDLYEKGGAKMYGADFVAADGKVELAARGGKELTFVGSASEALDRNATLSAYEWTFGDGKTAKGSTASHAYPGAGGVFEIVLKVTDSKGRTDTQKLKVGVNPALYVVNATETGTIALGLQGSAPGPIAEQGVDRAAFAFVVEAAKDGLDLEHVSTTLRLAPKNAQALDLSLFVSNATEQIGASTNAGPNEEIVLTGLTAEEYTALVRLEAGVNGEFTLLIETVYQPVHHGVMEFFGGHGGGHQH